VSAATNCPIPAANIINVSAHMPRLLVTDCHVQVVGWRALVPKSGCRVTPFAGDAGANGTDAELAAQWETNQRHTRNAYALLAQLLPATASSSAGWDIDQARDIAFTIAG
jgi:hypothetical protein